MRALSCCSSVHSKSQLSLRFSQSFCKRLYSYDKDDSEETTQKKVKGTEELFQKIFGDQGKKKVSSELPHFVLFSVCNFFFFFFFFPHPL